ncbi:hypothetical protein GCM10010187_52540 [Actinomadura coerulea]|nr:hypothetical protein GCM10010187_52540 [Actinomadura coerulea]
MVASQLAAQLTAQNTDAAANSSPVRRVRGPVASSTPTTAMAAQLAIVAAAAAGWSRQYGQPARSASPATAAPATRARLVSVPNHGGDLRLRGAEITTTILSMLGPRPAHRHREPTGRDPVLSRAAAAARPSADAPASSRRGALPRTGVIRSMREAFR